MCLGIRPGLAKYEAVANMWDLLQALYSKYQSPTPLNYAAVAEDFLCCCTNGTAPWYLVRLERDVDATPQNSWSLGLAMFCGSISESINVFLMGTTSKAIRGRRGVGFTRLGRMSCSGASDCPSIGRIVQAQCMTWLFAYFHVPWVLRGGPWSQLPCSGRDAMEVRIAPTYVVATHRPG